ncbi:MAG: Sec-independent protein translocase protein TatB [Steroidobacteraceae bacterium]
MFEVGFQEIVLIALLALIVLGPEKLPKLAAKLGHWTGRARSMARNLRQQLENEVSYDELLKQKQEAEDALRRATEAPMNFHQDVSNKVQAEIAAADTEIRAATSIESPPAEAAAPHTDTPVVAGAIAASEPAPTSDPALTTGSGPAPAPDKAAGSST